MDAKLIWVRGQNLVFVCKVVTQQNFGTVQTNNKKKNVGICKKTN